MPTNSKHLIHKKSNATTTVGEVTTPKLPTSDDIRYGEIAINYKKGYETISTLNDQNEIVEFASKNFVSANYASLAQLDAEIAQAIADAVAEASPSSSQQALIDAIMESVTKVINNAVNAQSPTGDQQALLAAISASVAKAIQEALAPGSTSTEIINQINAAIEAFMGNSDKFTGSGTVTVSHDTENNKITINSPKPDWNATAGANNEILNKPSIPTVNDATFKIYSKADNTTTEVGGTSANASSNTSVTLVQGSNVTLTTDATNKEITIAATDTNTTYTFAGGTNKITVTPSGGSAQEVAITPSIDNNVTYTGSVTTGHVTTFNSAGVVQDSGKTITTTNPSGNSDDNTIPTSKAVWGAIADGIATTDAMVYKTTINGGNTGDYGTLTPAADKGHTYKVAQNGKIDGVEVKVGDLLLCNTDNTPAATASDYSTVKDNWDFVHTTLDGTLFKGNNSFTDGHVLLADGTTGKVKDSGCTIETSVPSNAVFTDTTYTFTGGTNKITVTPSGGSAQDVTITPSIDNNVTYTGSVTSGRVATFNSAGVVQDSGFTIGKSVPSDAVFTDTTYEFDGTYDASTNKAATKSTVTNAIGFLDGNITNSPASSKTLTSFSQTNGVVSATFSDISITKSQVSDFPTIPAAANDGTFSVKSKPGTSSSATTVADFSANQSTADDVTFIGGNNITLVNDTTNRTITINHDAPSTSPAKSTQAIYPISIDSYGHITGAGNAVTNAQPASGGDTLSLVTTGEKYTWNSKGNGDVTGPSSSVNNRVATFNGTTGKAIQDSGFTIAKSVPANAVFTDTKVTQTNTTDTTNFNVLFSSSTATTTDKTEGARKSENLQFNPGAGVLISKSFAHTPYTSDSTSGAITINARYNGDLHFITLTGDVSGITISNPVAGQNITVILYNSSDSTTQRTVTINHTTSSSSPKYICPNAEALSLTVPAGGYCEAAFLVKSATEIFVRGV